MKRIVLYLLLSVILIAMAVLFFCGRGKPVLRLYNWADYIAPEVIEIFQREYGCEVRSYIFYSNEEMYDNLRGGGTEYDVVVPSSYMAARMFRQGMVHRLDLRKLPNVTANIDESYLKYSFDPKMEYCVPYFISFTGIGYDKSKVPDFRPSWRMFEREDLKGRCALLDDEREVISAALRVLGKDINSTAPEDIDAATEVVLRWKKLNPRFEPDAAKLSLASGHLDLIQTYSGDILQEMDDNPDLAFVIPEEGSTCTLDNLMILKNSRNPDLAAKFINFLYRPDICAKNMEAVMYLSPNPAAVQLVPENLRNSPAFNVPEAARDRCRLLGDLGPDAAVIERAWEKIKGK